jgi:mRNA interferase MazF
MTPFNFGDVVLIGFPFTNLQATKKRPAVVISNISYQQNRPDVVLMAITGQLKPNLSIGEYVLQDWQTAGLAKPSMIKPLIATLEQTQIIRSLGKLTSPDKSALRRLLAEILR